MNGYLVLAICKEDAIPIGLLKSKEAAESLASVVNRQDVDRIARMVFETHDVLPMVISIVQFEQGYPVNTWMQSDCLT